MFIFWDYSSGCSLSPKPWPTTPLSFPSTKSKLLVGFSFDLAVPLSNGV
jgi:hypothetical protein